MGARPQQHELWDEGEQGHAEHTFCCSPKTEEPPQGPRAGETVSRAAQGLPGETQTRVQEHLVYLELSLRLLTQMEQQATKSSFPRIPFISQHYLAIHNMLVFFSFYSLELG